MNARLESIPLVRSSSETDDVAVPDFREWVRGVARELNPSQSDVPSLEEESPGSDAEAITLLTAEHMLAPDGSGVPFVYRHGGDKEGAPWALGYLDLLAIALYIPYYKALIASALGKPFDEAGPHEFILFSDYLEPDVVTELGLEEPRGKLYLHIAGVAVGKDKDTLLFSDPAVPLGDLTASDREDLRRIYDLVAAARLRA